MKQPSSIFMANSSCRGAGEQVARHGHAHEGPWYESSCAFLRWIRFPMARDRV